MKMGSKRIIGNIESGTCIDHLVTEGIPAAIGVLGIDFSALEADGGKIYLIGGVDSSKYGNKAVLKVQNIFLSADQKKKLLLLCPRATISEIARGKVSRKYSFDDLWGETIRDYLLCYKDTSCITRFPKEHVASEMEFCGGKFYKCAYCESEYSPLELKFLR